MPQTIPIQSMFGRSSLIPFRKRQRQAAELSDAEICRSAHPKIVRVTNSAVNKLATMPMISVMPNPFTSSVPNQIRNSEVMTVSCWSRRWR